MATVGLDDSSLYSGGKILLRGVPRLPARLRQDRRAGPGRAHARERPGRLRLKLRLTYVGPRPHQCLDEIAVWGDARLLGVPSEVPTPDPNAA